MDARFAAMRCISHDAPIASALSAAGAARVIARTIAAGQSAPDEALSRGAHAIAHPAAVTGKVHALGAWHDRAVHAQLAETLGTPLGAALRPHFEWYSCRGAFFHNDAHYDARLFGVWCIAGPAMELVFPRAAVRLAIRPADIVVFDPFEVHGVLIPEADVYNSSDYQDAATSIFLGFELDITPAVANTFGIRAGTHGYVISSRTRINATNGTIERD
ncbi:MAG TPA: hypothetical protein VE421_02225 [Burkholderiaceae bacterium]|nr:hypothetical protein [Burkholderiaceae bacterium]